MVALILRASSCQSADGTADVARHKRRANKRVGDDDVAVAPAKLAGRNAPQAVGRYPLISLARRRRTSCWTRSRLRRSNATPTILEEVGIEFREYRKLELFKTQVRTLMASACGSLVACAAA